MASNRVSDSGMPPPVLVPLALPVLSVAEEAFPPLAVSSAPASLTLCHIQERMSRKVNSSNNSDGDDNRSRNRKNSSTSMRTHGCQQRHARQAWYGEDPRHLQAHSAGAGARSVEQPSDGKRSSVRECHATHPPRALSDTGGELLLAGNHLLLDSRHLLTQRLHLLVFVSQSVLQVLQLRLLTHGQANHLHACMHTHGDTSANSVVGRGDSAHAERHFRGIDGLQGSAGQGITRKQLQWKERDRLRDRERAREIERDRASAGARERDR
jgi:hypothetical protein